MDELHISKKLKVSSEMNEIEINVEAEQKLDHRYSRQNAALGNLKLSNIFIIFYVLYLNFNRCRNYCKIN
jgi:hypothetical protein